MSEQITHKEKRAILDAERAHAEQAGTDDDAVEPSPPAAPASASASASASPTTPGVGRDEVSPMPEWAGPPVPNGAGVNTPPPAAQLADGPVTNVNPIPRPAPPATALVPTMPAPLAETATTAAAAQAKAAVESRYVVAWRNPRSEDAVRGKLLRECQRPRFAKVARYSKPIGGGKQIEGPSIRFVEAAMRCMGNIEAPTEVIYDDDDKRIMRVSVTDLETNTTYPKDVVVTKLVERRHLRKGQQAISSRTNASGQITHTVRASEDDLLNKEGALVSKAMRVCGLRLIPGDLVDEGMDLCRTTERNAAAKDPDAARKEIADGFAQLNITAGDLEQYLGHDLSKCSPAQLVDLRALFAAVREGETTWAAVLEASGAATGPATSGADNLKAALGKKA